MIRRIQEAVTIPVMAKCRIGHFAEAQILQSLEIDYIDEVGGAHHRPTSSHHVSGQVGLHGAVRVRRDQPRRGVAAYRGGRGDDPHQRRSGHRRRRQRRAPHARRLRRHTAADVAAAGGALRRGEGAAGRPGRDRRALGRRATASCRSSRSPRAASPPRPTRRSACSSAPTVSSSARGSSSRATRPSAHARSSRRRRTSWTPTVLARVSRRRARRGDVVGHLDGEPRPTPISARGTRGW